MIEKHSVIHSTKQILHTGETPPTNLLRGREELPVKRIQPTAFQQESPQQVAECEMRIKRGDYKVRVGIKFPSGVSGILFLAYILYLCLC